MPRPIIDCRGVTLIRDGKTVLKDIDWQTYLGEHWVVLGPNGCGKTSLMEMLMGYLWPNRGELSVLGYAFGQSPLPELREQIGYLAPWQFEHSPSWARNDEIIGPVNRQTRISDQMIEAVAGALGIEDLLGQTFGRSSSGQQFLVLLARAMVCKPRLLILDEPFSFLDMGTRRRIYDFLNTLLSQHDAPQVLLVTHYLEDIQPFISQALLLRDGRVWDRGQRGELLQPDSLDRLFG